MAKPSLHIQFASPASPDLMHRVLNFIEDVYRAVEEKGIGTVDDIDHYGAGLFVVRVAATRHIGEVRSLTTALLKRHMLEHDASVKRAG
jgi:hypothetical protein